MNEIYFLNKFSYLYVLSNYIKNFSNIVLPQKGFFKNFKIFYPEPYNKKKWSERKTCIKLKPNNINLFKKSKNYLIS